MSGEQSGRLREWWPPIDTVERLWIERRLHESGALVADGVRLFPDSGVMRMIQAAQRQRETASARGDAAATQEVAELVAQAVALAPSNPDVLINCAAVLIDAGDTSGAGQLLQRAAPLKAEIYAEHPLGALLCHLAGFLTAEAGNLAAARDLFTRARELKDLPLYTAAEAVTLSALDGRIAGLALLSRALLIWPNETVLIKARDLIARAPEPIDEETVRAALRDLGAQPD